jgi:hypothetical protein
MPNYQKSSNEDAVEKNDIGAIVREAENNFVSGTTTISKYVHTSMYENLNTIDAYLNSKHISGATDSQDREKPFFNIVTAAVNIWYRATDIDRKNIKIKATKAKSVIGAFLATVLLQDWMRRSYFGTFLNEWGRTLARYGSAVVKFVEKGGELHCMVVPWNRLIVDAVDFESNVKIEVLELTEAQLYKREGYKKDMIEKLCDAKKARETTDKQQKDQKSDYIKVYEVHGELPLSYLTGKEKDQDTYVQQMHAVSFVASKEEGKFDDFTLASGREEKEPNMITHLIKEDGQTLSIGAVQHLFEAQWMMNHTIKSIKDQLDLASKIVFQTSDGSFAGQNALFAIENGDILVHKMNEPLTQLNNGSHDITSLQSFGNQWKGLANEITGISESMLGNTAPSGTAWRQVEALLNESHSLFELMTENKGLYIEQMLRTYVIPFLKKKLKKNKKEISAILESYDITRIDSAYIRNKAVKNVKKAVKDKFLKGEKITPEMQAMMLESEQAGIKESLSGLGNQRFFKPDEIDEKTWNDVLDDLEWDVEVDVTGESVDRDAMTTLDTVLKFLIQKQGVPMNQDEKMVFNKILMLSGTVSPLELSNQPQPSPMQGVTSPLPATPQAVT